MFRKIASILLTGALAFSLLTAPIAHGAAEVYFSTDFSQVNGGSDFGFDNPQPDEAYFTPDTNVSPYEGSGPVGKLISTYTGGGYFYRHIPDPKISVTDTGLILEIKIFVTDTAIENVTDTENGLTSDSGKGHSYTVDSLNENSRFVRITLSKTKANAWGTRMYQAFICSDGNAPTQLIETDTQDAALSDELILKFNNQLYQPEISADDFSITSAGGSIAVAAIEFTDQYRGLKLKLDNILEANTQYTISYSSLVDIYNQAAEGSVEVQTGAAPSVSVESMAFTKDGAPVDAAVPGTYIPQFVVNNTYKTAQPILLACAIYNGSILEDIVLVNNVAPGESQTISLSEIELSEGRTAKLFAWDPAMKPLK